MAKTLQEIQDFIRENDIEIVDFKLTDIDGRWRHLSIPAARLTEGTVKTKASSSLKLEATMRLLRTSRRGSLPCPPDSVLRKAVPA